VHGTDIGIAVSGDGGGTWLYRGAARGLEFEWGRNTFWAPEIFWAQGQYHMFASYIRGVPRRWAGHDRQIRHYVSANLIDWTHLGAVPLASRHVIDAAVFPLPRCPSAPAGGYRMWFKDEEHGGGHTYSADSTDLADWTRPRPVLTERAHEGPNVFALGGYNWLVVDEWRGLGVYRSDDLEGWERNSIILDKPGRRPDDQAVGRHADIVVAGESAHIFYFTHPEERSVLADEGYECRRSSIQVAEVRVRDGVLTCDRDREISTPFLPVDGAG
jgi:hypothetical protein